MVDPNAVTATLFPQVMLYISCRKLKDVEFLSKTDPVIEVFEKNSHEGQWVSIGHTELQWNQLNPDFTKSFLLDFHFEEQKFLKFKLWDGDNERDPLRGATFIGEAECTLGEIVGSPGQQLIRTMRKPGNHEGRGNIILRAEETVPCKQIVYFRVQVKDLKDVSGFMGGSLLPFLNIYKAMENGQNLKIHTSQPAKGKNARWDIQIPMNALCNNDFDRTLHFEIMHCKKSSGNHKLIGTAETCLRSVTEGQNSYELHKRMGDKKKRGKVAIENVDFVTVHSFLDYIAGGCQINLMMAIDFTASNGHPSRPDSLHRMDPNNFNDYEKAIYSVGEILLNYDTDKKVPMLGYGGKLNGLVSHCFHMNFDPNYPDVAGLDSMLMTYRNSLMNVELSGPTLFSQVIQRVVLQAESTGVSQTNQQYFVLLIITDGEINDMRETIDWIVRGSFAPLSIIIVGVGNGCDFRNMDILDGDKNALVDSKGAKAERDIVQFVPFKKVHQSSTQLAKEVLDELPREILNYFKKQGVAPNPPRARPEIDLTRTTTVQFNPNLGTVTPENLYQNQANLQHTHGHPPGNLPPGQGASQMPYGGIPPQQPYGAGIPPQQGFSSPHGVPPQHYTTPPQQYPNPSQSYSTPPQQYTNPPQNPQYPPNSYSPMPPQGNTLPPQDGSLPPNQPPNSLPPQFYMGQQAIAEQLRKLNK